MAMQELTQVEVMEVSGGDRNLGTLYEYTGNPKDRTIGETIRDMFDEGVRWVLSFDWAVR